MARILIVDDDEHSRKALLRLLREHECVEAASGTEAIEKIASVSPDLILLDQRMPHMDGLMTLAKLRQIQTDTQFIMITAEGTVQLAVEALKQGALDFIVKPVDTFILKHTIGRALQHIDLLREKRDSENARRQAQNELIEHKTHLESLVLTRTHEAEKARLIAEQATKAKSEFLANISHELRTPMQSILNFANFGIEQHARVSKEKLREYFAVIHDSGTRLLTLVNDLLDLSKLESKKQTYHFVPLHIAQIIQNVIADITPLAKEKRVTISVGRPHFDDTVSADEARIAQAIHNVLANAIKASPEKGTVTITITQQEQFFAIAIADNGISATPKELENIFFMFSSNQQPIGRFAGCGLGLAIVHQIVTDHRGRVMAQPNHRDGVIFTILLPSQKIKS